MNIEMVSQAHSSPRAERTRSSLITAGFELLVERPIDAIPIDDVVTKAGVSKGSFFNHFADKHDFASAIAREVRLELEALVAQANSDVADPIGRIARGMWVSGEFAIANSKRTTVLLRSHASPTARAHPLNKGVVADFEDACANGLLRQEAHQSGVLYWLGLCQALMANLIERKMSRSDAEQRIADMLILGLSGLGINDAQAIVIASEVKASAPQIMQFCKS
jgi:AcrR family transcriptional regulator